MDQIKDELLHYVKGVGMHAFSEHLRYLVKDSSKWCPFINHKGKDGYNCYLQDEHIKDLLAELSRYQLIVDYVENEPYYSNNLASFIENLVDPVNNFPFTLFNKHFNSLISLIETREKRLHDKLSTLTCLECIRLDEAITCQVNNCFLSTTVMAVSATEARLHYLIKKTNPKIYKEYFEEATLGQLIELFDENKYKEKKFLTIKKLVPKKHRPLLDIFNNYRIVSAHPKAPSLDHKIAKAILNLAFAFLLDPEVKIIDKKLLRHR